MKAFSPSPLSVLPKQTIKNLFLKIVLVGLACPISSPAVLMDGPLGKISLTVNARATYDSNVFSMPSKTFDLKKASSSSLESSGDLLLELTPAAHFTKKIKMIELQGTLGARAAYFVINTNKSFVNPITTLSIDFDESLTKRISNNGKIRFDAIFDVGQKTETSILENDLTSYTYYSVGLNTRYNHSPKFGVGGGTNYTYRDYQSQTGGTYQDVATMPVSGRVFYIYSPKLDFFAEYIYSPTKGRGSASTAMAIDAKTHTINLGAQGDLFTKASGSLRVGRVIKKFDNDPLSQENLSLLADLSWKFNQKTGIGINLSRDFQPSPQNNSILSTSFGLSLNHRLNEKMSGEVHLNWSSNDYTTPELRPGGTTYLHEDKRSMDMIGVGCSLRKQLSQRFDVGAGYDFSRATQSLGNFMRHMLFVDVNGRY